MILEVDNIELNFKNKRILSGIYLKAETDKATAILGSNGCGKSSLLDIIFGNLKPKYKLIRIDNKPILQPLYKTGFIKYLPQYHFIPDGIAVKTAFNMFGVNWEEFASNFNAFKAYKSYSMGKLSGGERRVIETYLVLKSKSLITILDEPFSHLAPIHIEAIKTLIKEEKRNKIVIVSDHMYLHIIDSADKIYLLKNATTKEIKNLKELESYRYLNENVLK
ncbi:ABC transporter ATP-binding protein [uncultured Winogradskyella sp.]|uniref:ATP-binding cassette domain-containing protein n=1 Tax=uncultured Winogradskyella sp. TaxID=395353 RepID=UPI00263062FE|nr:ABC transporter ATP-binding protein [uncultured Winogradskyella sp.]